MTGITALAFWVLSWAPDGYLLHQQIESADELEHRLVPWRALYEPVRPIWLTWPDPPPRDVAVFLPAESSAWLLAAARVEESSLKVPRLILSSKHYRPGGDWAELEQLAPDSVERLVHALLRARWHQLPARLPALADEIENRAQVTMAEVPEPYRREAFLTAASSFASHLLSISHEIGRHQRRRASRGQNLCAALDHPVTLFGTWRQAIEQGEYRGYKPRERPGADGGAPSTTDLGELSLDPERRRVDWVWTSAFLSPDDKRWILSHLGVAWTGNPRQDFSYLCPEASR